MGACQINRKLLPVKFTYFFELAAVSSLLPYLSVYMRSIGLTYSELSIIYGASPFVSAVLRALIGIFADKVQKHKQIIIACCVLSGLFHGLLLLTPKSETSQGYNSCTIAVSLVCDSSESRLEYCPVTTKMRYKNGNFTLWSDPFLNASSCVVECALAEDGVPLYCFKEGEADLKISHCVGNESTTVNLVFSQEHFANVGTQYSPRPNCYQHLLQNFTYNGQHYSTLNCAEVSTVNNCHMTCSGLFTGEPSVNTSCSDRIEVAQFGSSFWIFFMLFLTGQVFFAPIFSLVDAIVYNYLGNEASKWGQQRLWGTLGFATFAVISGFVMDSFIELNISESFDTFSFAFILFAVLSVIGGIVVQCFHISGKVKCAALLTNIYQILRSFRVLVLLSNVFIFGFFTGIIETFLFVRLFEIGAPKLLMGLCMVINCLPEILILMCAGFFINRIGIFGNICIVYVAYMTRLIVYAFLKNPWFSLLVEPLHSITFGLMFATVTFSANEMTPPGMHGTIQSVVGALYFGFGKGTGSILSGQVYQLFGPQSTFLTFGLFAVLCLVIHVIIHFTCLRKTGKKRDANEEKEMETDDKKEVEMNLMNVDKKDEEDINDQI